MHPVKIQDGNQVRYVNILAVDIHFQKVGNIKESHSTGRRETFTSENQVQLFGKLRRKLDKPTHFRKLQLETFLPLNISKFIIKINLNAYY